MCDHYSESRGEGKRVYPTVPEDEAKSGIISKETVAKLSEDKALELMEKCLVQGLKEWAVVTDLKARVTALEQQILAWAGEDVDGDFAARIDRLEKDIEQMYQENRGNGP